MQSDRVLVPFLLLKCCRPEGGFSPGGRALTRVGVEPWDPGQGPGGCPLQEAAAHPQPLILRKSRKANIKKREVMGRHTGTRKTVRGLLEAFLPHLAKGHRDN